MLRQTLARLSLAVLLMATFPALAQTTSGTPSPSANMPNTLATKPGISQGDDLPAPSASPAGSSTRSMAMDAQGNITAYITAIGSHTYVPNSLQNLSRAYVKLTGVDLNEDKLIDDFAAANHCRLYKSYYQDEFLWRQAREAIRKTIQRDLENYPEYFYLEGRVTLGRYDFEKKAFEIDENSRFKRTGAFSLEAPLPRDCEQIMDLSIPVVYNFRLKNPVTLDVIPVSEAMAYQITRYFETKKVESDQERQDRSIYATFLMRIDDFNNQTGAGNAIVSTAVRATLLSLRFFLDKEKKILIYDYRPR